MNLNTLKYTTSLLLISVNSQEIIIWWIDIITSQTTPAIKFQVQTLPNLTQFQIYEI